MSKLRHTGKPKDTWTRLKTRARLLDTGRCKASAACLEGRRDAKTRAEIQGRSRRRRRGGGQPRERADEAQGTGTTVTKQLS